MRRNFRQKPCVAACWVGGYLLVPPKGYITEIITKDMN